MANIENMQERIEALSEDVQYLMHIVTALSSEAAKNASDVQQRQRDLQNIIHDIEQEGHVPLVVRLEDGRTLSYVTTWFPSTGCEWKEEPPHFTREWVISGS